MKRFQFPLERVRRYRQLQLESEQAKLEELHNRLRSLDHMEAELERQRRQSEQELLAPGAALDGRELERFTDFRAYTTRVAALIAGRRAVVRKEVEAQRARVVAADRKHEVLDRLKGRSKSAWKHAASLEQENLAAELYLLARRNS